MRGGERGNQRTFSSAFGEFQTTRPPTVDSAGHPTKRVEHDTTQQTEMCRKYIACAENVLNAMFKLGKIMLLKAQNKFSNLNICETIEVNRIFSQN